MRETVKKIPKKLLSILLAALMAVSTVPFISLSAFAEGEETQKTDFTVTVIDTDKNPVEKATVKIGEKSDETDEKGEVTFKSLEYSDNAQISVTAGGYADEKTTVTISAQNTSTTVTLKHIYTVSGTVTSNVKAKLKDLKVTAKDGTADANVTVDTDKAKFSFSATEGNDASYTVSAKNHVEKTVTIESIKDNKTDANVTLEVIKQTISLSFNKNGEVTINGESRKSGNNVEVVANDNGSNFSFSAYAATGYHIAEISGDYDVLNQTSKANNNTSYSNKEVPFLIDKDSGKITVSFDVDKYEIKKVENYCDITVFDNNKEVGEINYGSTPKIEITPKHEYNVENITIGNKKLSNEELKTYFDKNNNKFIINDIAMDSGVINYINSSNDVKISVETKSYDKYDKIDSKNISITEPASVSEDGKTKYYGGDVTIKKALNSDFKNIYFCCVTDNGIYWGENVVINATRTINNIYIRTDELPWKYYPVDVDAATYVIDKNAPKISAVTVEPSGWTNKDVTVEPKSSVWTNKEVKVSGKVTDEGGSGIDYVVYSKKQLNDYEALEEALKPTTENVKGEEVTKPADAVKVTPDGKGDFNFTIRDEQKQEYYIYAVDKSHNIGKYSADNKETPVTVQIDKTAPVVTGINFYTNDENSDNKTQVTFGEDREAKKFATNKKIIVEVTVLDYLNSNVDSSKISEVDIYDDEAKDNSAEGGANYKKLSYKAPPEDDSKTQNENTADNAESSGSAAQQETEEKAPEVTQSEPEEVKDAGGNVIAYKYTYTVTLESGKNALDFTDIKAQAIDGAGNASGYEKQNDDGTKTFEAGAIDKGQAEKNNQQYLVLISQAKPYAKISDESDKTNVYQELTKDDEAHKDEKFSYSATTGEGENAQTKYYRSWYPDQELKFNVSVSDNDGSDKKETAHPGIKSVVISVNGQEIGNFVNKTVTDAEGNETQQTVDLYGVESGSYSVSIVPNDENASASVNIKGEKDARTATIKEGENTVEVKVENYNNTSFDTTYYFYRDVTDPEFKSVTAAKADGNAAEKILRLLTFGIFSNDNVKISLTAGDKYDNTDPTDQAGIKQIELYTRENVEYKYVGTVTANNQNSADGIKVLNQRIYNDTAEFTVNLGSGYKGNLYAKVTDNVNNVKKSEKDYDKDGYIAIQNISENDNIYNNHIILENSKPAIEFTVPAADNSRSNVNQNTKDDKDWYADDFNLTASYSDSALSSGLYETRLKINGSYIVQNEKDKKTHRINNGADAASGSSEDGKLSSDDETYSAITSSTTFTVNTKNASANSDGSYKIDAYAEDNAGNKDENYPKTKTIYIDRTAPEITKFEFDTKDYQDSSNGKKNATGSGSDTVIPVDEYGYYFKTPTKVTITSNDKAPASGVNYITVKFVKYTGEVVKQETKQVDKNNQAVFDIDEGFKGQIVASATDNVGHQGDYVTPDGVIYEINKSVITFNDPTYENSGEKSSVQAPYVLNEIPSDLTDEEKTAARENTYYKNELFNGNAYVPFDIDDSRSTDSGIRRIEWEITAPAAQNTLASGYYEVNNNKQFGSYQNNGEKTKLADIQIDSAKNENNLVHHITGRFLVKDNYNDIVIKITVTDRSGNQRSKSKAVSIDKTAPKIKITFEDNDKETGNYANYYNKDRVAVITVNERNFDPKLVEQVISNIDPDYSSAPDIKKAIRKNKKWSSKWKTGDNRTRGYNVSSPDSSEYVFKFKFKAGGGSGNGIFDLKFNLKDRAGNDSNVAKDKFTIDATLPVVALTYSDGGESSKNTGYFKEDRTVTVTITEHNFNAAEFKNLIEQSNNGDKNKKIAQPKFSSFKKTGKDEYQATATCADSGKYFMNVSFEDMAGNEFILEKDMKNAYSFDVDHFAPEITVSSDDKTFKQVKRAAYNQETIIPTVTIVDKDGNLDNYVDTKSFVISIQGTKHQLVKYDYSSDDRSSESGVRIDTVDNGYKFTLNFLQPKTIDLDDIYWMNVKVADKAGNTNSWNMTFSVNRYGSTYDYNLKNALGGTGALAGKGSEYNDLLYLQHFVLGNVNSPTVFTEYNVDSLINKDTKLTLNYTNTDTGSTEKSIELSEGSNGDYIVVPGSKNDDDHHLKTYEYKLTNEQLFNKDGTYRIYATTKDGANNINDSKTTVKTPKNTKATEKTRCIIQFVVDNTAPSIESVGSNFDNPNDVKNNDKADVVSISTNGSHGKIKDDNFASDGKSCYITMNINEQNLGLDAIDMDKLSVKFGEEGEEKQIKISPLKQGKTLKNSTNVYDDSTGNYQVKFTLKAPENSLRQGDLLITIADRAGNTRTLKADDLQITNNWFIRFLANRLALGLTIAAIVLIAAVIIILIVVKRRKKRDDEE